MHCRGNRYLENMDENDLSGSQQLLTQLACSYSFRTGDVSSRCCYWTSPKERTESEKQHRREAGTEEIPNCKVDIPDSRDQRIENFIAPWTRELNQSLGRDEVGLSAVGRLLLLLFFSWPVAGVSGL